MSISVDTLFLVSLVFDKLWTKNFEEPRLIFFQYYTILMLINYSNFKNLNFTGTRYKKA